MPLIRELVRLSAAQLSAGGGQQDIDYMLDRPPYTRYFWNGDSFEAIGGAVNANLTAAEIAAAAAAGTLTPLTWYAASDTGVAYWCSSTSVAQPLSTAVHLGTITTAAMLAYSSPTEGMTCYLLGFQIPPKMRHNGTYWAPDGGRQQVHSIMADVYNATADGTTRVVDPTCQLLIPMGLLAVDGMGLEVRTSVALTDSATEAPTLSLRCGTAGDGTDTAIYGPVGVTSGSQKTLGLQPAAVRTSATGLRLIGAGDETATTYRFGNKPNQARPAAITVGNWGSADNYLSLCTQRAGAFGAYLTVNAFDVWLTGR